ncbi:hypothetical protein CAOG_03963 [Capsaspora owczarzaki ATCC 30864]|uniref:hypothetical protein n=1 Tax=Capsaspora owczarzaki (strain ATCC 30864) TaxID=595528 RepID=UPI0001FE3B8C|nr:hypothetical protein CAOG_03963 [Capsaspora owczarzaki ATCC 30864]|eukprot:XP_004363691.1 hypothetical protein CAOG_03963 [Capsaspora owczarzaki ATCC 30864]
MTEYQRTPVHLADAGLKELERYFLSKSTGKLRLQVSLDDPNMELHLTARQVAKLHGDKSYRLLTLSHIQLRATKRMIKEGGFSIPVGAIVNAVTSTVGKALASTAIRNATKGAIEAGPGTHWVCVYNVDPEYVYYFDSFGLDPPEEVKKFMKTSGKKIIGSIRQVQDPDSVACGWFCLDCNSDKMETYCLRCKSKTEDVDPAEVTTPKGRLQRKSKCGVCGAQKSRFLKQEKSGGMFVKGYTGDTRLDMATPSGMTREEYNQFIDEQREQRKKKKSGEGLVDGAKKSPASERRSD